MLGGLRGRTMSKRYAVKEVFPTLQGEGLRAGTRAVFVRFAGCNLWDGNPAHRSSGTGPCAQWCDTDFFKGTQTTTADLLKLMNDCWPTNIAFPKWCVLTGGEPALQVDEDLVHALHDNGWRIAVETNGTVSNVALQLCDHVCVAPKLGTAWKKLGWAHEIKVVLPGVVSQAGWSVGDMLDIESFADSATPEPVLFVQPQDPLLSNQVEDTALRTPSRDERLYAVAQCNMQICVRWVLQHPRWRLSIQTHKFLGLP